MIPLAAAAFTLTSFVAICYGEAWSASARGLRHRRFGDRW